MSDVPLLLAACWRRTEDAEATEVGTARALGGLADQLAPLQYCLWQEGPRPAYGKFREKY